MNIVIATDTATAIQTARICPVHEVRDEDKLTAIAESMELDGWNGRPLVVMPENSNGFFRALTGSHRHAAATEIGFDEINCLVLTDEQAEIVCISNGWNRHEERASDPDSIASDLIAAGFTEIGNLVLQG